MEIIGKSNNLNYFKNALNNGTLHHFYVLEGPDGIGKRTLARHIARMIHCEGETKPCGVCPACIKHLTGNHPDFYEVKDTTDKAKITVETARKTIEDIYVKPLLTDKKIYLIDDEKPIEPDVQNILLKVLEEPPAYTIIFMNVINAELLLPTVRSRAVTIRVELCRREDVLQYLSSNFPDAKNPNVIAELSGGNLGVAGNMAREKDYFEAREQLYSVLSTGGTDTFLDLQSILADKDNISRNMNLLLFWLRDAICVKNGGKVVNTDHENAIRKFAETRSKTNLMHAAETAAEMCRDFKKGSNAGLWAANLVSKLG